MSSSVTAETPRDAELLQKIYLAHSRSIPFSSVAVMNKQPLIWKDSAALKAMATNGRGGVCFEQTTLMKDALLDLGFKNVRLRAGEVMLPNSNQTEYTTPLMHRSVFVEIGADTWVLDVGYPSKPPGILRLVDGLEQLSETGSTFMLTHDAEGNTWYLKERKGADEPFIIHHRIRIAEFPQDEQDKYAELLFQSELFLKGWLLQIFGPDLENITFAAGTWAGRETPPGKAKFAIHPLCGGETHIEHIDLTDPRIQQIARERMRFSGKLPSEFGQTAAA